MKNGHWSSSLVVNSFSLTDCFYVHSDSRCCGESWRETLTNTHYGLRKSNHMLALHYCDVSLIPRIGSLIKPTEIHSWDWWMSVMGAEGWVGCFCLSATRVTKDICATCQRDMTQSILGDSPKSIPASLITGRIRDGQTRSNKNTYASKHNSNNCLMSPLHPHNVKNRHLVVWSTTDIVDQNNDISLDIHDTRLTEKAMF